MLPTVSVSPPEPTAAAIARSGSPANVAAIAARARDVRPAAHRDIPQL
jgi:hypothetical protein